VNIHINGTFKEPNI